MQLMSAIVVLLASASLYVEVTSCHSLNTNVQTSNSVLHGAKVNGESKTSKMDEHPDRVQHHLGSARPGSASAAASASSSGGSASAAASASSSGGSASAAASASSSSGSASAAASASGHHGHGLTLICANQEKLSPRCADNCDLTGKSKHRPGCDHSDKRDYKAVTISAPVKAEDKDAQGKSHHPDNDIPSDSKEERKEAIKNLILSSFGQKSDPSPMLIV